MKTCNICVEEIHEALFIKCPKCDNEFCHTCFKEYAKTLKQEVKCMCCNMDWDQAFVYRNIPLHIVYTVLREKREDVLYEREKAQLPAAQLEIQGVKYRAEVEAEMRQLILRLNELKLIRNQTPKSKKDNEEPVNTVVCGCPKEECRGFITKPGYSCGICETMMCSKCYMVKGRDQVHVCKGEDLETAKTLKAETKPCPGCGATSQKVEGCSQCWCCVCKKAWNWSTGQLDHGAVHATDYLNYLRKNGQHVPRAEGDDADADCDNRTWSRFPRCVTSGSGGKIDQALRIYRKVGEYQYPGNRQTPVYNNVDIAMQYLENEIDEKKWRALILKRDKQNTFNLEIDNMKNAYFHGHTDMFAAYVRNKDPKIINNILAFQKMMEDEFVKLAVVFKSRRKVPFAV